MRRSAAAALALALALAGGCGDGDGDGWPASQGRVDRTGIVYASGEEVHLGDGSTIDLGTRPERFLLAGDGVVFVPAQEDGVSGPLLVATEDGVTDTGASADATSLVRSADGRYLGFVDLTTGEEDRFGTPVAQVVVVDLATGEEVVRTEEGMGDPDGDDDLLDLYEDTDAPSVVAVTEDAAYVRTPTDGIWAYDLPGGDGRRIADSSSEVGDEPWYPSLDDGPETNPAGTWTWDDTLEHLPRLVPTDGGRPVPTRGPRDDVDRPLLETWGLSAWLDDDTVLGGGSGEDGTVLITCAVPSGRCDVVPGTEDGVLLPLDGLEL